MGWPALRFGTRTGSISIAWQLVRNANAQASPRPNAAAWGGPAVQISQGPRAHTGVCELLQFLLLRVVGWELQNITRSHVGEVLAAI